jgi:hypothetical protein
MFRYDTNLYNPFQDPSNLLSVNSIFEMPLTFMGDFFPWFIPTIIAIVFVRALVLTFTLCTTIYNRALAIILTVLLLVPIANLFVLLLILRRASKLLKISGIKISVLGADLSQFQEDGSVVQSSSSTRSGCLGFFLDYLKFHFKFVIKLKELPVGTALLRILGVFGLFVALEYFRLIYAGEVDLRIFGNLVFVILCGMLVRSGRNLAGRSSAKHKIIGCFVAPWLLIMTFTIVEIVVEEEAKKVFVENVEEEDAKKVWVDVVKNTSFDICPNRTLGEMADSFMAHPQWEFVGDLRYVNVSLAGSFQDGLDESITVNAKLYFRNGDVDWLELYKIEYDGVLLSEPLFIDEANNILELMCLSAD